MAVPLILGLIVGVVCALLARQKGRSVIGWFFCGFFVGLVGLIIILCLSNLKKERAERESLLQQQRRLREQLRQERIKNESFRLHAAQRLDMHDNVLGIETRTTTALPAQAADSGALLGDPAGAAPSSATTPSGAPPQLSQEPQEQWYYARDGQPIGPLTTADFHDLCGNGTINGSTLVWSEVLIDWTPAGEVAQLTPYVQP